MRRACCDTLEEHGIDSHLDSCEHFPPKRYTQADLDRAVEAERERVFKEAEGYIQGYAAAVRKAGYTDTANTLIAVMQSIAEMRARGSKT